MDASEKISNLMTTIGQTARIRILMVIAAQEACVCHLEAALGLRQASISQHLMILRKAGLVTTRRVGRHVFYLAAQTDVADLILQSAALVKGDSKEFERLSARPISGCSCPQCNPELGTDQTCRMSNSSLGKRG